MEEVLKAWNEEKTEHGNGTDIRCKVLKCL